MYGSGQLAAAVHGSPFADHSPPLIDQLFAIQNLLYVVPGRTGGTASSLPLLSVDELSKQYELWSHPNSATANGVLTAPSTATSAGNVSAHYPPCSPKLSSPAKCADSPTVARGPRKIEEGPHERNSDVVLRGGRLQATAEFTERGSRGFGHFVGGSAVGASSRYPVDASDSHDVVGEDTSGGLTSGMIGSLSIVEKIADTHSVMGRGRGGNGGGVGAVSEEDLVLGLRPTETYATRGVGGNSQGSSPIPESTISRALSSKSHSEGARMTQGGGRAMGDVCPMPLTDIHGRGLRFVEDDDEFDYPLLSPMDMSKAASPSHGVVGGGHGGRLGISIGSQSSQSVGGVPSPLYGTTADHPGFVRSVSAASAVPLSDRKGSTEMPKAGDVEQANLMAYSHRHIASQRPVMYSAYIEELEQKIKEEEGRADALDIQLHGLRGGVVPSGVAGRQTDEMRLREDFARELYRVKQQLEDLKERQAREESWRVDDGRQGRREIPPLASSPHRRLSVLGQGDRMGHRRGSSSVRSSPGSPFQQGLNGQQNKVITVKVVKGYEDDPVPYPKPSRTQRPPTPAYSESFVTQSPSPSKRKKDRAKQSGSMAYSSFDNTASNSLYRSYMSESVASFVSEAID